MTTVKGKRTIYVGPAGTASAVALNVEGLAISAVRPGALVVVSSSGIDESAVAATVAGQLLTIADSDQMRTKAVDVAWTIGDSMVAIRARDGEFFNALVAISQTLAIDTPLTSAGDGTLKIATPATDDIVAYAAEVVTTTAAQLVLIRKA